MTGPEMNRRVWHRQAISALGPHDDLSMDVRLYLDSSRKYTGGSIIANNPRKERIVNSLRDSALPSACHIRPSTDPTHIFNHAQLSSAQIQ